MRHNNNRHLGNVTAWWKVAALPCLRELREDVGWQPVTGGATKPSLQRLCSRKEEEVPPQSPFSCCLDASGATFLGPAPYLQPSAAAAEQPCPEMSPLAWMDGSLPCQEPHNPSLPTPVLVEGQLPLMVLLEKAGGAIQGSRTEASLW